MTKEQLILEIKQIRTNKGHTTVLAPDLTRPVVDNWGQSKITSPVGSLPSSRSDYGLT